MLIISIQQKGLFCFLQTAFDSKASTGIQGNYLELGSYLKDLESPSVIYNGGGKKHDRFWKMNRITVNNSSKIESRVCFPKCKVELLQNRISVLTIIPKTQQHGENNEGKANAICQKCS